MGVVLAAQPLWAEETELPEITVEATKLSDVSGEEVKSADLAEALTRKVPNISLVRRSGIANDIILRGQKKDNINVLIDNAKIYGACPNRMDPPISHVLTNNIEGIEITEGPYDVENFGTLSGAVKIITKQPEPGFGGEVSVNVGSWGYRKGALTLNGGNDKVRALVSVSGETSEQYEDGDGNTFAEQIDNFLGPTSPRNYKEEYRDLDAYDKKTFMGKVYVDVTENQELGMSYTANRSDDILYPNTPMDALYDDSDIMTLDYTLRDLGSYSRALEFEYYLSKVEHPMSTFYRIASGPDSINEKISKLTTRVEGFRVKNIFDLNPTAELMYGLDFSKRNWNGHYEGDGMQQPIDGLISIDDVDTKNGALFVELDKDYNDFNLRLGARYDDTEIQPGSAYNESSNDYQALNGYLFGTYQVNQSTQLFGGVGRSSRVPDARELYFHGSMISPMGMPMSPQLGTPDLDQTFNTEIDFGVENRYANLNIKTKLFYSWLKDYIYYDSSKMQNRFVNIDATIYGLDIGGTYYAADDLYLDFGVAYQRGRKDKPLAGQTDKDLAEIPPAKLNLALNYDYLAKGTARVEMIAASGWDDYDADNGEQEIGGYAVFNLKLKHRFTDSIEVAAGIDNLFDRTYAVSNTYKDLTLLADGTGEVMLLNEPGRYYYLNGTYRF
jgi:iron complex outermembrane receptor protein